MTQKHDLVKALSLLPHGAEFKFLDELLELQPGQSARARWTMKGSEEFLKGHFPNEPILPGVLMVEALAQLGGILAQTRPDKPLLKNLRLTGVRQFKILGTILPGQTMGIKASLSGSLEGLVQIAGEVFDEDGKLIGSGSIVLAGEE